jgi:hypothetical protein
MANLRPALLVAASLGIAGCTSPSTSLGASHATHAVKTTRSTSTTGTTQMTRTTLPTVTTQTARTAQTTAPTRTTMPTQTTTAPAGVGSTTPVGPGCTSGTVTVRAMPGGQPTPVCVTVGSTVVLTGGEGMSGGTWPGPPTISNTHVVTLVSSTASGTNLTASLRAISTGTASIDVPFVAGPDVCNPTPCTPVPGARLVWEVTVVG